MVDKNHLQEDKDKPMRRRYDGFWNTAKLRNVVTLVLIVTLCVLMIMSIIGVFNNDGLKFDIVFTLFSNVTTAVITFYFTKKEDENGH